MQVTAMPDISQSRMDVEESIPRDTEQSRGNHQNIHGCMKFYDVKKLLYLETDAMG